MTCGRLGTFQDLNRKKLLATALVRYIEGSTNSTCTVVEEKKLKLK